MGPLSNKWPFSLTKISLSFSRFPNKNHHTRTRQITGLGYLLASFGYRERGFITGHPFHLSSCFRAFGAEETAMKTTLRSLMDAYLEERTGLGRMSLAQAARNRMLLIGDSNLPMGQI